MNPEIYTILDDMRSRFRKDKIPIADCDKQIYLSIKSSDLLVLLAEENEKAAKKIGRLTNVLIVLTLVIAILTAALVFLEVRTNREKLNQNPNFSTETTQQNKQTDKMKQIIPDDKSKKEIINHK